MSKFVVPMLESERGWGSKIDGYAGPFESKESALTFMNGYNLKYNNKKVVPDYYIVALEPEPYTNQKCDYRSTL